MPKSYRLALENFFLSAKFRKIKLADYLSVNFMHPQKFHTSRETSPGENIALKTYQSFYESILKGLARKTDKTTSKNFQRTPMLLHSQKVVRNLKLAENIRKSFHEVHHILEKSDFWSFRKLFGKL